MQIQEERWLQSFFIDKWRDNDVKILLKIISV